MPAQQTRRSTRLARRRSARTAWIALLAVSISAVGGLQRAIADSILIGRLRLDDATVLGISAGTIEYRVSGRKLRRDAADARLYLDAMPSLREAETALDRDRIDDALRHFNDALAESEIAWHRAWVHFRRSQVLDAATRFPEAVEAWASVLLENDENWWASVAPVRPPLPPVDPAAVDTALARLTAARIARGADPMLRLALDDLEARLIALRPTPTPAPAPPGAAEGQDDAGGASSGAAGTDSPSDRTKSDLNAVPPARASAPPGGHIADGTAPGGPVPPADPALRPDAQDSGSRPATTLPPPISMGASRHRAGTPGVEDLRSPIWPPAAPDALDRALLAGEIETAAEVVARLLPPDALGSGSFAGAGTDSGGDTPAEYTLHRLGLLQRLDGRPRDAALTFMRLSIFGPRGLWGRVGLVEAARVYRDDLGDSETAMRLLQQAHARNARADAAAADEDSGTRGADPVAAWVAAELDATRR